MPIVGQNDAHAGIQEGEFAQAVLERVVVELHHRERRRRRHEGDLCPATPAGVADDGEGRDGNAVAELDQVLAAVAPDAQAEPDGEGVHDRDSDAVEAAGDLVGILVELTAGVQLGHDDLGRGDAFAGMDVGGNAAPVVGDRHRAVGVERHVHRRGVPGQRLVDRVVDDLVDHVVQARAVVGVADIHAGALADGVQPLEHLDGFGAVCVGVEIGRRLCHEGSPGGAAHAADRPRTGMIRSVSI